MLEVQNCILLMNKHVHSVFCAEFRRELLGMTFCDD